MTGPADAPPTDGETLSDYDFELPPERIALRPAVPRDAARLLVSRPGEALQDRIVRDLPSVLRAGDRLVVNNSRVIPARLHGERVRGASRAHVELMLLTAADGLWSAFARPAKRVAAGDVLRFAVAGAGGAGGLVEGVVVDRQGPAVRVRFDGDPLTAGAVPLPPYIAGRRAPDPRDETDYQTVYADPPGSVAAPTAGLHFTPNLLDALARHGIGLSHLTLHVGAGTFLPVKAERLDEHRMHAEAGVIDAATVAEIRATQAAGGRIVAVGTTALRLLESAARSGRLTPFAGETDVFIRPGFCFRVADALLTNFHLPRSTLMVLVAAFVGLERMRQVYAHALAGPYRFYSYGDASLLFRVAR